MSGMIFPALVLPNDCYIGDNVLLEPIASALAYREKSYVISNWPEMFEAHPQVIGLRNASEIPKNVLWRAVHLHDAIASTKAANNGDMVVVPDKMKRMYEAAGLSFARARAPRLFLNAREKAEAAERKRFFKQPLVGVVQRSRHRVKNWSSTERFVKKAVKEGWSVFLIRERDSAKPGIEQRNGIYRIVNRTIRELMVALSMMDVVIGPDTGPMQIAAALQIPTVVVAYEVFRDLYEHYPESAQVLVGNNPQYKGIKTVSAARVFDKTRSVLARTMSPVLKYHRKGENHCIVRFRGIGDIFLTLIVLANLRRMDGNSKFTYVTSHVAGKVVKASGLVDEVVEIDYDHAASGLPPLPEGFDFTGFDSVANLVNKVDFIPEAASVPRVELFAQEMGLNQIDPHNKDWQIKIPCQWKEKASEKLKSYGVEGDERFIALQADSEGLSRRWPIQRQKEFCGYARQRGYKVVALSNRRERRYQPSVANLTGETSIEEYVGIISLCSCLVGSDSSGIHVAGFLNVPAVGLFGSVDPKLRVASYESVFPIVGKGSCVPCNDWQLSCCKDAKKSPSCMWSIKAKRVFQEVRRAISWARESGASKAVERYDGESQ